MGEKITENFAESGDFRRRLLHAVNLRHGTDGFTSTPKEGVLRIFSPLKIRRLRSGLNPRTWVLKFLVLGILCYKCGMLLFLLFLGSERCKFEKWPADNAQKMTVQILDER